MSIHPCMRAIHLFAALLFFLVISPPLSAKKTDSYLDRWKAMNTSVLQPNWVRFFTHSGRWTGSPHLDVIGIYQPTYTDTEDDRVDTFGFSRARFGFRGAVTNDISFWTLIETGRNGVTGPTNGGLRLLDAQINWNLADIVNLRMGQFIPDFSQTIAAGAFVDWIDYTEIEKTVWFFNRQGDRQTSALRELGASVWNEYHAGDHVFNYEMGYYNGRGLNQVESVTTAQTGDPDDEKDIIAGVRYGYAKAWAHGGYWLGKRKFSGTRVDKTKYSATIGYGNFIKDRFYFIAEYLNTDEEQPSGADDVESDGFWTAVGYRPHPRWKMVYRYSECDCEDNIGPPGRSDTEQHTFALTHYLKGQMKIVAQYDINNDDYGAVDFKDDNAFRIYFSLPLSYRIIK